MQAPVGGDRMVVHSVGNNRKTIENNVRWYHDVVTTTGVTIHWCLGASAHVPDTSGGDRTQKTRFQLVEQRFLWLRTEWPNVRDLSK